jgi:hypothetical protein
MFEGLAIYNILVQHPAPVHVKVMGLAASAASIIAMAGDTVEMGLGSFLMIHNAWGAVIGNQNDMRDAAEVFAQFDDAMSDIYSFSTGLDKKKIRLMMDQETFMSAEDAVNQGFATGVFEAQNRGEPSSAHSHMNAKHQLDILLAKQGVPRAERRRILRELNDTHNAVRESTHNAALTPEFLQQITNIFKIERS